MSKKINKVLKYIGCILFRPFWWLQRLIIRNPKLWIFGSRYGQEYSDNSQYLFEYVLKNEPSIKAIWLTKSDKVFKDLSSLNMPVVKSSSLKGVFYSLFAKYCFLVVDNSDINPYFINGIRKIWLFHGMPLKKIGLCRDEYIQEPKIKKIYRKLLDPYNDYVKSYKRLTSSDFFSPFLIQSYNLKDKQILNSGLPRCDVFFSDIKDKYIQSLREKFPKSRIILYMPTFRSSPKDKVRKPFNPFTGEYNFNIDAFNKLLEKENLLFVYKPHFIDRNAELPEFGERFIYLKYDAVEDLYVLLNSVDALLTDYSSVYFDFLCTRKPIFLFPIDYDYYVNQSRGHYFNMYDEMTANISNSWDELFTNLSLPWKEPLDSEVMKFAEYSDGNSCKKIVDCILKR